MVKTPVLVVPQLTALGQTLSDPDRNTHSGRAAEPLTAHGRLQCGRMSDSAAFNTQVSILEQLPPHDPLSAHVQVLVVNNQQPPEAHTVLAQAQQRFGSHRSVRFASSPNCNPV